MILLAVQLEKQAPLGCWAACALAVIKFYDSNRLKIKTPALGKIENLGQAYIIKYWGKGDGDARIRLGNPADPLHAFGINTNYRAITPMYQKGFEDDGLSADWQNFGNLLRSEIDHGHPVILK